MRHILAQTTKQDLMNERDHILRRVELSHELTNDPHTRGTLRNLKNRLIALNGELDRRRIIVQ